MPELRLIAAPPREELLAQLRGRLGHAVPGARLLAERILGADARIDFVALEPNGRIVLILVGEHDRDLELVGRGLAQRAWVTSRLRDWIQLAPNLGLRPDAQVRVLLACPSYRLETRAAVRAIGPEIISLVTYRCVQNNTGVDFLFEHLLLEPDGAETGAPPPPLAAPFRTGLSDGDLGLTPEEQREFE